MHFAEKRGCPLVSNFMFQEVHNWYKRLTGNRLARNSLLNLIGFSVPILMMLVFTPLLIKYVGVEGYGLWSLSISILGMVGVFELGLGTAITKYVSEYTARQDQVGLSTVIISGFFLDLVMGCIITIFLYLFADPIARLFSSSSVKHSQITGVIQITAFGFIPLLLRNSTLAVPMGLQRYAFPTAIKIIQSILVFAMTFTLVSLGFAIETAVMNMVFLMWLAGLSSFLVAFRYIRPFKVKWVWSKSHSKQIFSFMSVVSLSGLGSVIFSSLDRLTVGVVLGLSGVTYYTVAIGIPNKLLDLSNALTSALMPAASTWNSTNDAGHLWWILKRSTWFITMTNFLLVMVLLVFSRPLLVLWLGGNMIAEILVPARILLVIYGLISVIAPSYNIANGIGEPWVCALGALAGGSMVIVFIILLGPTMGLVGTAIANSGYMINFVI